MLHKLFDALYNKVLINIVMKRDATDVYVELCSKKGVISSESQSFEGITPNTELQEYVERFMKESPFHYLAFLDLSSDQGALPSCEKSELSKFYDLSMSKTKCYDDAWTYFTSKQDINELEKLYKNFEIDFLFSPFIVLREFFDDKITTTLAMFALVQDSYISLAIFDNGKLLYADHLDMEISVQLNNDILSEDIDDDISLDDGKGGIDLEEIDVIDDIEEIEGLEDFGDIEDLDSLEEIDEFSENRDIEEEFYEAEDEVLEEGDADTFNEDYQRFSLIQGSLGDFYHNENYKSQFIESIYIADGVGVSSDLKRYLEEEMFLNVYIRRVELAMEIAQLTKGELGL